MGFCRLHELEKDKHYRYIYYSPECVWHNRSTYVAHVNEYTDFGPEWEFVIFYGPYKTEYAAVKAKLDNMWPDELIKQVENERMISEIVE